MRKRFTASKPVCLTEADGICVKGGSVCVTTRSEHGYCLTQGRRLDVAMEDFHGVSSLETAAVGAKLYAIFDGHGGSACASAMSAALPATVLAAYERTPGDVGDAIVQGFCDADAQWTNTADGDLSGTTATALLHTQAGFSVGHVGDSRAVLCTSGKAIQLTRDHRASDADEQVRILALGGWVSDPSGGDDSARVNDVLEVTRGLGDIEMKAVIRPDADVAHHELAAADEFVIIASDGLWDVISNDEAVRLVRTMDSAPAMAEKLAHQAWRALSPDHISVFVIRFNCCTEALMARLEAAPPLAVDPPAPSPTQSIMGFAAGPRPSCGSDVATAVAPAPVPRSLLHSCGLHTAAVAPGASSGDAAQQQQCAAAAAVPDAALASTARLPARCVSSGGGEALAGAAAAALLVLATHEGEGARAVGVGAASGGPSPTNSSHSESGGGARACPVSSLRAGSFVCDPAVPVGSPPLLLV